MAKDDVISIENPVKLPQVGQEFIIFDKEFKVIYRNTSKKIFTAEAKDNCGLLPQEGTEIIVLPFRYEIVFINQEKKRFNAEQKDVKFRFFLEDEEQI
jgi:hypothetical protein